MTATELLEEPITDAGLTTRERSQKVLILGNDDRVLLAIARDLGRHGIDVHVAWCDPDSPALLSRYISSFHDLPPYNPNSDDWIEPLNELAASSSFDLVIPCNDYAVVPLQLHRAHLDPRTQWYLINDFAFRVAFDKRQTSRLANELKINVPREFVITPNDLAHGASSTRLALIDRHSIRFPVFVKPRSSITQSDVTNKRAAQPVESPAELARLLGEGLPADGVLVQERFRGVGIGVEVLASHGRVLMQLQHQRLRETIDGGSTYRKTISEIRELTEATKQLVRRLDYTGVGMFEFRYDLETGAWVLLEINARFWGSLPLAIAAGANFPYSLYEMLVMNRQTFDSNYAVGVRCRNLINDLRAHRQQPSRPP